MKRNDQHAMRVAFRADASVEIGTGHVMRCLTLADALSEDGAQCLFLCRPHQGHLLELIAARGHQAIALPVREDMEVADDGLSPLAHAQWLGTSWANDAQDSLEALAGNRVDWLIVDHYALDHNWEQRLRPACRRLMVIDDLADRRHDCDLLLDQNLGRRAEDYASLLPPGIPRLIGPRYALLRPEFAALRAESLARRKTPHLEHLLVAMGGADKDNATGEILDALAGCHLPPDLQVTVVLGPHAPFLAQVRQQAKTMPRPTRVLAGVNNMAQLMTDADLAIGAAGSTSWERCCLGLPTIQLVLAENQLMGAKAMARDGGAILLGNLETAGWPAHLSGAIANLSASELIHLSAQAAEICDGKGTSRIHAAMKMHRLSIRDANVSDSRRIWEWRYANDAARYYKSTMVPAYPDHQKWFATALEASEKILLIICRDDEPAVHVRFDKQPDDHLTAVVSIYVCPAYRGEAIAGPSLGLALEIVAQRGIRRFLAEIHHDNRSSVALFERCGFTRADSDEKFLIYLLTIPATGKSEFF